MKYHFVVNGCQKELSAQMQEMYAFQKEFLSGTEQGETYIYGSRMDIIKKNAHCLSEQVTVLYGQNYETEQLLAALAKMMNANDIYIFGSDYYSEELAVRIAVRSGGSSVTDIIDLNTQERVIVRKMVYSNHMVGSFLMKKGPFCVSLARGQRRQTLLTTCKAITGICLPAIEKNTSQLLAFEQTESDSCLADAKIVVAAGRGMKSGGNAKELEEVTQSMGAQLGISRPAAMNAWGPMNRLIGVSGAMPKPDVCIAVGVSGAAAFYAGIEKSKFIVAVNMDEKAPIIKKADVVLLEDYRPVMKTLAELIKKDR